jgi:hypothetical protein
MTLILYTCLWYKYFLKKSDPTGSKAANEDIVDIDPWLKDVALRIRSI